MSKLGLALAGTAAGLREYERLKDKDRRQGIEDERLARQGERFDWERQRAQSELALLPEKEEAERTGHRLKGQQNMQALGLVDLQADNARKRLELEGMGLDSAKTLQPLESAARFNKAQVSQALSAYDVADLPRVLAEKKMQGAFSEADVSIAHFAKLGQIVRMGDSNQALNYINAVNDTLPPEKRKGRAVTLQVQPGQQGEKTLIAKDAQGNITYQISSKHMEQAASLLGGGAKTEYKTVNAGDSLVAIKGGQATPIYTAPESERAASAKMGPTERDVEYLVRAHGMTPQQALSQLTSSKSMSRQQFVQKMIAEKAAANYNYKPSQQDIAEFNALYESIQKEPASNSSPQATLDPKIKSLIGIP